MTEQSATDRDDGLLEFLKLGTNYIRARQHAWRSGDVDRLSGSPITLKGKILNALGSRLVELGMRLQASSLDH